MSFTGNEGEQITLAKAIEWTANYRAAFPDGKKASFFGSTILGDLLEQTGCVGLRLYYALDDEGVQQIILVGVDATGKDMCSGIIAERGVPCPPYCDNTSPLAFPSK